MPVVFEWHQGFLRLEAQFRRAAFDLLQGSDAIAVIYDVLRPLGVKLSDIKIDAADGVVGKAHIGCALLEYTTNLRVGFEQLEIECVALERVDERRLDQACTLVLNGLKHLAPDGDYAAYVSDLALHGLLPMTDRREFMTGLVSGHVGNADLIAAGATLYYRSSERVKNAAIVVDASGIIDGGVFFRNHNTWNASMIAPGDLPSTVRDARDLSLGIVGLTLTRAEY